MKHRPAILLTGFGPFPGIAENASALLVPQLAAAARCRFPDHRIHAEILATEWRRGPARVATLAAELRPVLALHFGVSSKATGFTLEARAHNLARPLPDAAGQWPMANCLAPEGSEFIPVTFPVAHAVDRLRRIHLPAVLSRNAGGYLCNAVLYASLQSAERCGAQSTIGFVHLPSRLANGPQPGARGCRLMWQDAVAGSLEIIALGIGQTGQSSSGVRLSKRPAYQAALQRSRAATYS